MPPPRNRGLSEPGAQALRNILSLAGVRPAGDLTAFYSFVGEQDLLARNPSRPRLSSKQLRRVVSGLRARTQPERSSLIGLAELCAGRCASACSRLSKASVAHPTDGLCALLEATAWWVRLDAERTRRWLPQALSAAERAVRLCGPTREALLLRAQILFEFEDNAAGLRDLAVILRRWPKDFNTRIGRAEILTDLYRHGPALKELRLVERVFGRPGWFLAQRGRLHGFCGRLKQSLIDFNAALKARPKDGAIYSWRAETQRRLGRMQEARADAGKAMRLSPEYAFSWEIAGRLALSAAEDERAFVFLDRAYRLDPSHQMAALWRAEAAWKTGRLASAWKDLDAVAPLPVLTAWNAPSPDGKALSRQEREAAFWTLADDAVRARAGDAFSWALRGRALVEAGRMKEALADLTRAAALGGAAKGHALAWRGRAALLLGAFARAEQDLSAAIKKVSLPAYCAWRAEARWKAGRTPAALSELDAALKIPSRRLAPYYELRGDLRLQAGRREEAKSDYETAFVFDFKRSAAKAKAIAAGSTMR